MPYINPNDPNFTGRFNGVDYINGRSAGNGFKNNTDVVIEQGQKFLRDARAAREKQQRESDERSKRLREQNKVIDHSAGIFFSKEYLEEQEKKEAIWKAQTAERLRLQAQKTRRRRVMVLGSAGYIGAFLAIYHATIPSQPGPLVPLLTLAEPALAIVGAAIILTQWQASKRKAEMAREAAARSAALAAQAEAEKAAERATQEAQANVQASMSESSANLSSDPSADGAPSLPA